MGKESAALPKRPRTAHRTACRTSPLDSSTTPKQEGAPSTEGRSEGSKNVVPKTTSPKIRPTL